MNIFDPGNSIYQSATKLFPQTNGTDPYIQSIINQGITAGNQARKNTIGNLVKSGFGQTTFAEPLGAQSASLAQQPFIQAAAQQTSQNKQQQIQNLLNALQLGNAADIQQRELQAKINALNTSNDWTNILGGAQLFRPGNTGQSIFGSALDVVGKVSNLFNPFSWLPKG